MAYSTQDDIFRRYPPIESVVGSGDMYVATADITSVYIPQSDSYIDAYLRARYVTPLAADPLLTMLSSDISIYKMLEDHAPRVPDMALSRWVAVNSMLYMLANGTMLLNPASQTIVTSGGDQDAWSSNEEQCGPVFHPAEDFHRGWGVTSFCP